MLRVFLILNGCSELSKSEGKMLLEMLFPLPMGKAPNIFSLSILEGKGESEIRRNWHMYTRRNSVYGGKVMK